MKKIDDVSSSKSIKESKKEMKNLKKERSMKRRSPAFNAFVTTLKVMVSLFFVAIIAVGIWLYNQIDFSFGDDLDTFDMKLTSTVLVQDKNGEYVEYDQYKSVENRVWVDIENVPQNLKDAFVAIEDERFYTHNGMDLKRTLGAVFNVFVKGDSSYGGSTITQQLVKNLTKDNERTSARKFREITRSMVLESKFSKDEILELYINSIYLSQGVYGVQAAAYEYFGKPVNELNLTECATLAGITQYPKLYDPIINPDNNKKKRNTILKKMNELEYITDDEYNEAINYDLRFANGTGSDYVSKEDVQSYYSDYMFEQVKADLMKEFGYPEQYAESLIYNGGLKIYSAMDAEIQKKAEEYYLNDANFPKLSNQDILQSAIVISDHNTGQVKAVVGGRGKKSEARVLNRATQSTRQPGSTIKPIAVYGPAIEEGVINLSTYIDNGPIKIDGWTPKNANGKFSGPVPVQTAVAWSYNMPAIRVLQALTIDTSFEYLHDKMHFSSLVEKEHKNGINYTDKNLPSLSLGGLTNGATPLEMCAAYSSIANGGMYIEPTSYTKIYDKHGNILIDKEKTGVKNRVFSEETAFLTRELLKGVVRGGTAAGSTISGMDTCGKTGTTDSNKDKWFIGFTPYYCTTVWVGFDNPRVIGTGSNPAVKIWRDIMTDIHKDLSDETFDTPSGIVKARVCGYTGKYASGSCGSYHFADKSRLVGYCGVKHSGSALLGKGYIPSAKNPNNNKEKPKDIEVPSVPSAPTAPPPPSVPSAPTTPTVPTTPTAPTTPPVPTTPTEPTTPTTPPPPPSIPTTPTVPSAPSGGTDNAGASGSVGGSDTTAATNPATAAVTG